MTCQYATPLANGRGNTCGLGFYGGKPSNGVCSKCMEKGENNESFSAKQKSASESYSLLYKAQSLANSIAPWAINGFKLVDEATLETRMETCKGCEFWDSSGFAGTGSCKKCGCSTQAKLRMATSKCPIDKWGAVDVVKTD